MNSKKLIALVLALLVCLSTCLTASAAGSFTSSKAGMRVRGAIYRVGSTSTAWKKKLGSYTRREYDGCTCGSKSYMYTFRSKGVKVETLVKGESGSEKIISIILSKKSIKTASGLGVGDALEKMTDLYGTNYRKSGNTYTYKSGSYQMAVQVTAAGVVKKITIIVDV